MQEPSNQKKKRRWPYWVLAVFVGFIVLGALVGEDEENGSDRPAARREEPRVEPEPEERATREAPDPDGSFSLNCDYLLGDFSEGPEGYRFVGGGKLRNTGNIGIVTETTFKWQLLGTDPVTTTETVKLRSGQNRNVQVTVPATQDQIDAHQSADSDCNANVKIVETFGKTPFE